MEETIKNRIENVVKNCTSILYEDVNISDISDLIEDLGFDSITVMQLVLELEKEFGITLGDDFRYEDISNLNRLESYIKDKLVRNGVVHP